MTTDANCLFCKIIAGQIPSTVVYQDDQVFAFRDIHPQAKQHILLVPRLHIVSMAELSHEHGPLLAHIYEVVLKIAQDQGFAQSGYRVVTNVGPDSGQAVFHLHFHVLGGEQLGLFGAGKLP